MIFKAAPLVCGVAVVALLTLTPASSQNASKKARVPEQQSPEAPAAFDNKSNGTVDDPTHAADQGKFDEIENVGDGLGPLYNAQSCRECHQNPTSGGGSQVSELRVGHLGPNRRFENPNIPIARGAETIMGRTLVNDRAICPSAAFPDTEIQERVPDSETVRTTRISLNVLGDGFVEAVADQTLVDLAREQCRSSYRRVCGLVVYVPIVEAPGRAGPLRLERPACEPFFVLRRHLLERDGNYQCSLSRRSDQALQHGQRAERQAWVGRTFRHRSLRAVHPGVEGAASGPDVG